MPNQKKEDTITQIQDHLANAQAVVFADYRGLTAAQMELLRKKVRETGSTFHIYKNSLTKLALERAGYEVPDETVLEGPTVALFANNNYVTAFKTLTEFAKETELPSIKGGYLNKSILGTDRITIIANLPALEVLQAKLLGQLNSPITGLVYQLKGQLNKLVYTLNAIEKTKE